MTHPSSSTHSADVSMWLDCGHLGTLDLCRITETAVEAKQSRLIPPCHADLVVVIDGRQSRTRVNLIAGFSPANRTALALPIDDIAPF